PPDVRPGSRSRIGILRRYRLCLPSEPGGSARENVALHFELAVLTPQTLEVLALGRGQPVRTPTLLPVSLCPPGSDRLRRRPRPPSSPPGASPNHTKNHPSPPDPRAGRALSPFLCSAWVASSKTNPGVPTNPVHLKKGEPLSSPAAL